MAQAGVVRIAGRLLDEELLKELQQVAPACSRRALAQRLCQAAEWHTASGKPALMSARKALAHLTRQGHLPPAAGCPIAGRRAVALPSYQPIQGSLEDLGPLELVLVKPRSESSRCWRALLDTFHYLGAGPLCGAQLRYLVLSTKGPVAALSFSAAALKLAPRDHWIGWSAEVRRQNLHRVVNNSRFLIPPHVEVPNLASHVLGQVLRRLPADWQEHYGYQPLLVESFVELNRFSGGSYRAANFQAIGITQGRGRQDQAHQRDKGRKVIWVFSLSRDFRPQLQAPSRSSRLAPLSAPRPKPPPPPPADWAEEEFGRARLPDRRLIVRCCEVARALYARPQSNLPQACGSRVRTKATYRFFQNPRVTMNGVLQSHYEATARRMAGERVVLAVQDTTSLNYSTHPATEMLGPISTQEGVIGLLVHSTLAFNTAGTPLGLLQVQSWTRAPEERGKRHRRYELALEAKESVRWLRSLQALEGVQASCPGVRLVSVGDREADMHELFAWATEKENRPALLVRAERKRLLADGQGGLWEHVFAQPVAGELAVKVPRRRTRAARVARLEVRFAGVVVKAPKRKPGLGAVKVWAVTAREVPPPGVAEPLEWMLLTTLPVDNLEQAVEKLRWYTGRWGIEVFHRVLKSGCQIETRQLAGADGLEACLAIDMVVAWRIYYLTKLGRETPEVPCTVYFEEHEWKALMVYVTRKPLPASPPSLRQALRMTAQLGGFLGRKGDGEPGTETLWRGLQRLDDIAEMYLVMSADSFDTPADDLPVSSDRDYG
jgi:hypothetical protein